MSTIKPDFMKWQKIAKIRDTIKFSCKTEVAAARGIHGNIFNKSQM